MSEYTELMDQISKLQEKAGAIKQQEKAAAITRVKDIMREYDLQVSDLGTSASRSGRRGIVAAKYRHPETAQTWSGRGKVPRWLQAELDQGNARDIFAVKG